MNNGRRTAVALVVSAFCLRGETAATDQEWSDFIKWLKALPLGTFGNQREVFPAYEKKLIAEGMAPRDAEVLAAGLQKRSLNSPEWTGVNFDRIYAQAGDRFLKPDAVLVETVRGLKPGKALDIGMGEGRNAIFLGQQGWDVTGLDLSEKGVAEATERARKLGIRINARVQDVYKFDFGVDRWDLICLLYFGKIPDNHRDLCQRIASGLQPGGRVIVEGTGLPPLETLLAERDKWLPTKLRLIRLEYLASEQSPWSPPGAGVAHMILQKPL